jgi:glutathione synthase/RimK-type ligase-like ATP-grasp enzyme
MIRIHDCPGGFSDRWIHYCLQYGIPFRRVNCLAFDVIKQCRGLRVILWEWNHVIPTNALVARQIIASLEAMGVQVFPNFRSCWHYDDKLAQQYLLEAIGAPIIPTWVFLTQQEALDWIHAAKWPKVFKLRCGAGSSNVRLVQTREEALALCNQAFGRGFPAVAGYLSDLRARFRKAWGTEDFWRRIARAPRTLLHILALRRRMQREQGYHFMQEFLPDNAFDTRITIIGDRAFGYLRINRPNDFRASGSGNSTYEPGSIDQRCVGIAFDIADQIGTQSLAFDFLFNPQHEPLIGEISYCYVASMVHDCQGYWDRKGTWYPGQVWPEDAILEDVLAASLHGKGDG